MPALTWQEKFNQQTLYQMGYQYLIENFHKFKEDNKIRVALEVIHIFNKDGSKSDAKQIVYVINSDRENVIRIKENPIEVFPSQITADNPPISE